MNLFTSGGAGNRNHFYLAILVLAGLFAIDAVWWQGQQLGYDYEDSASANVYFATQNKDQREADAINKAVANVTVNEIDSEFGEIDQAMQGL